jgi:hypothetical protein
MIARLSGIALLALIGLASFGCGQTDPPEVVKRTTPVAPVKDAASVKESTPAKTTPVAVTQAAGNTLIGVVTWAGDPLPIMKAIDLGNNADKATCQKKGPVMDEFSVVNPKNKGLRDAFVWLEPMDKDAKFDIPAKLAKPASPTVEVDQPDCAFIPRVVVVREGQTLVAKNSSSISHNIRWNGLADGNAGSKLIPPGSDANITLKAEKFPVAFECNIHGWMKGYAKVIDHPYWAITDADGKFTIADAPAGPCRLKVWHGSNGWLGRAKGAKGQEISVSGGVQDLGALPY